MALVRLDVLGYISCIDCRYVMIEAVAASLLHVYTVIYLCLSLAERNRTGLSASYLVVCVSFPVIIGALTELNWLGNLVLLIALIGYLFKEAQCLDRRNMLFYPIISVLCVALIDYVFESLLYHLPIDSPAHFVATVLTFLTLYFGSTILQVLNQLKAFSYFALLSLIAAAFFLFVSCRYDISPEFQLIIASNRLTFALAALFICVALLALFLGILIKKNNTKKKQLDAINAYTSKLELRHDELELFKHDYLNILLSLGESIYEKDIDKIERVYNDTIRPTESIIYHDNTNTMINKIKLAEIKSLFIAKMFQAERKGLSFLVEIVNPVTDVLINTVDFLRICSITIDNSIEATEHTRKKEIEICLLQNEDELFFLISNPCEEPPSVKNDLYTKHYTTKKSAKKTRGLGLYSLKRIIERYPSITIETKIQNDTFQQIIVIKQVPPAKQ